MSVLLFYRPFIDTDQSQLSCLVLLDSSVFTVFTEQGLRYLGRPELLTSVLIRPGFGAVLSFPLYKKCHLGSQGFSFLKKSAF